MANYKKFFEGKRITVMGLGLLGRGVKDAIFLAECGAELLITDLKSKEELAPSLAKLKKFKNIRYSLGGHKLEDFSGRGGNAPDFILKAAGVPLDSPFIAEAKKNNIPIEMDASLFAKFAPEGVTLIGITGTRGKTTTTYLIYEILKCHLGLNSPKRAVGRTTDRKSVVLGGNIKGVATLPLLKKVKSGDFVVAELDSWQLQGFHDAKISPNVAVFTTFFDDHLIYYKGNQDLYFSDKEAIFKYQRTGRVSVDGARHDSAESDVLVVGEQVAERVSRARPPVSPIIAHVSDIPSAWQLKILGEHNRANAACALAVARALKIPDAVSKKAIESFKGVSGRLELVRTVRGVKIYNDTTATTPEATIAALRALSTKSEIRNSKQIQNSKSKNEKNIILIMGGSDKGLDMSKLVEEIPKFCKAVVFLEGTGTEKLIFNFQFSIFNKFPIFQFSNLKDAVAKAFELSVKGDVILFSPAFASFGMFKNEYDRGEQFNKIVESL